MIFRERLVCRTPAHSRTLPRLLACLIGFCALAAPCLARADWLAGAAKVDITPDVHASHIPLGGYAARKAAPSTGVHDPVYARALVLSDHAQKVGIVSVDLCFLPANVKAEIVKQVRAAGVTGLGSDHLLIAATHTHTAPDPLAMHSGNTFTLKGWTPFDPALLKFTAAHIAEAIVQADRKLAPARVGSTSLETVKLNRNRRGHTATDPTMSLLKVTDTAGHGIAAIIDFAAHPTLWDDSMLEISADWPGVMTASVEKSLGEGAVCLFLNGAEGDASPNGVDNEKGDAKVQAYGDKVAALAWGGLKDLATAQTSDLSVWSQLVTLPPRKARSEFIIAALTLGASIPQAKQFVTDLMPQTTHLMFVRAGGLLLMGFPCEPTANLGLEAKEMARKAGFGRPAIIALSNDWLAYALTPEQYQAGEYEAMMSFYGDQLGPTLLTAVQTGLKAGPHSEIKSP